MFVSMWTTLYIINTRECYKFKSILGICIPSYVPSSHNEKIFSKRRWISGLCIRKFGLCVVPELSIAWFAASFTDRYGWLWERIRCIPHLRMLRTLRMLKIEEISGSLRKNGILSNEKGGTILVDFLQIILSGNSSLTFCFQNSV